MLRLRWQDIDFKNNRVLLPQTKNGEGRIVYLNLLAAATLDSVVPSGKTLPMARSFGDFMPAHVSVTFSRVCKWVRLRGLPLS